VEGCLRFFSLSDVRYRADYPQHLASVVEIRASVSFYPTHGTVGTYRAIAYFQIGFSGLSLAAAAASLPRSSG